MQQKNYLFYLFDFSIDHTTNNKKLLQEKSIELTLVNPYD